MLPQDFNFADRLMDLRVTEEQRRVRTRRLQKMSMATRTRRLTPLRNRLLRRSGRFLVALGERLEQHALPQVLSLDGGPNRSA